ncbi:MAG: SUMF1/EgtB/PvdO family nonheme iron enzyme, partial [Sedimenticola sp.]
MPRHVNIFSKILLNPFFWASLTLISSLSPRTATAKSGMETKSNVEPDMVEVPSGSSRIGSNSGAGNEKPVHRVTLPSFKMSRHEITKGQFAVFVQETGYRTDAEKGSGGIRGCYAHQGGGRLGWVAGMSWRYTGFDQGDSDPVVCVSLNDAQAFTDWLSKKTGKRYRLPTESQWEYAARAGSNSKYSFGNDEEELCLHANGGDVTLKEKFPSWKAATMGCTDGFAFTSPVGSFQTNPYGLHDMHGNVWEWTVDCWNETYADAPRDGSAWESG